MTESDYKIKLPVFEGPFDLLFHLIKKAEVDIWAVSIAEITDQYLQYLQSMKELNLEIASEFLVMAATLLRLKSKMLLPRPAKIEEADEELFKINSAEELFLRLEEYRYFKGIAEDLRLREEEQQKVYLRSTSGQKVMVMTRQESVYTIWEGANHLSEIMLRFLAVTEDKTRVPTFRAVEDFIITDKSSYIESLLRSSHRIMPMKEFLIEQSIWEVIITFVSLLEMTRQGKVYLFQEKVFEPILVQLRDEIEGGGK